MQQYQKGQTYTDDKTPFSFHNPSYARHVFKNIQRVNFAFYKCKPERISLFINVNQSGHVKEYFCPRTYFVLFIVCDWLKQGCLFIFQLTKAYKRPTYLFQIYKKIIICYDGNGKYKVW